MNCVTICSHSGKNVIGKVAAAQEKHRHVERLNEDHAFLRGIDDRGDDEPDRAKREAGDDDEKKEGNEIGRDGHAEEAVRENEQDDEPGEIEDHAGDQGGAAKAARA